MGHPHQANLVREFFPRNRLDIAFSFLAGDIFAKFDIAYSGVEGKEEPSVNHPLSGGSEDQRFRPTKCTIGSSGKQRADNCPHFEMAKTIGSLLEVVTDIENDVEGKQWTVGDSGGKGGQGVKGGKGILKVVNFGWEPAGIHPFGTNSHTKFVLKDIKEHANKPSTARLHLAFQYCVYILFTEHCTPHFLVIPTPFTVREGGWFLVASRRSLRGELAKLRNRTLNASGFNQIYCDPENLISTAGQSDTASTIANEDESTQQLIDAADEDGIVLQQESDGSISILADEQQDSDGLTADKGEAWLKANALDYGFSVSETNAGLSLQYTGGAKDQNSGTAVSSTPLDPEHNVRQYLARIARGESTGGINTGQRDDTGAAGEYQFIPSTRQTILERHGLDGWSPNKAERDQAVLALIADFGNQADVNEDIIGLIQKGDFARADALLGQHVYDANGNRIRSGQFTSLPGGAEAHRDWNDPALLEAYGPTGNASTNSPSDLVVSSGSTFCQPKNGSATFAQGPAPEAGEINNAIFEAAKEMQGFDSSGGPEAGNQACAWAVDHVLARAGVEPINSNWVPTWADKFRAGKGIEVSQSEAQPGDIVLSKGYEHIGVCMDTGCNQILSNSSSRASFSWVSDGNFDGTYDNSPYLSDNPYNQIWRVQ